MALCEDISTPYQVHADPRRAQLNQPINVHTLWNPLGYNFRQAHNQPVNRCAHLMEPIGVAFHIREVLHGLLPKSLSLLMAVRAPKGSVHLGSSCLQALG